MQEFNIPKKIFVVDDDMFYLELLKNEIKQIHNTEVKGFSSAEHCLEEIDENPDLVILDYNLNGENPENMSGHDALTILQANNPKQKIVFISSEQNWEVLESYDKYRFVNYMVKSDFLHQQLKTTIQGIMLD